ncbi:phosphotransferase [Streptomyces xanthii]|uniref:Phosphotransferase n=1 Tax=Streptomyces xanthii TaxID=2768069 RepID=A0A7H1B775_9ACTN|nr:phosphotransferase [Streptomyces xanthii]QNS04580.1 phosphotransferase [Streptomyces xanthii]
MTGTGPEPLPGGLANAGAVFRTGETVDRPAPPHASALHAQLRALRARGFDGAPLPVAHDPARDRERLTYVPGDVALPPFPPWAMTDASLRSVGALLRRLHDASALDAEALGAAWPRDMADPEGGTVLCHNDVCPENVVFRDGRAVALIDFDLAAPGRPVWDLAMTARYWIPMLDPHGAAHSYPPHLDAPRRLTVLADAYGLAPADRAALPATIEEATAVCRAFVAARLTAGDPHFTRAHAERGGWPRWDRLQTWLEDHRGEFMAALTAGPPRT